MTNTYLAQAESVMIVSKKAGDMPVQVHNGLMAQAQVSATMAVAEELGKIAEALDALVARDSFS